jgi:membrane-associated phospholipid phosphatase
MDINMSINKNTFIIIFLFIAVFLMKPMHPQSQERDTTIHPYHVNYWVTGGVLSVGLVAEKIGVPWISDKSPLTSAELQALDRNNFTAIDRWSLDLDPSNMDYYVNLSDNVLTGIILLPALTMLDNNIRKDWLDVLLMYCETIVITNNAYLYTPLGPTFQNRLRPVVYYDELGEGDVRTRGSNRNSFYSGHVASATAASFFAAKIFCDYHPEFRWEKYLVYSAATIPPLIMSYLRIRALAHFPSDLLVGFGVGALFGILIPELHRIKDENISLGLYSSFEGTGIRLRWQTDLGK